MKIWNLDKYGYWVIKTGCQKLKRAWNVAPLLQIVQKICENYCPRLFLSIGEFWWLNELWFKRSIQKFTVSCINTHHDVIDLVNHEMVKNTKTWISWELNIIFLQNKILNQCLIWHILRSYCFVVEISFKFQVRLIDLSLSAFQIIYSLQIDNGIWKCVNSSGTGIFKNQFIVHDQ